MRSGSNLGSWMCFQASSAGPSAYCFAFSRKEGMSSKHCRAGPSRCSPARSGRVGLPLPRWLLPEVNSRSYAPRLRRVGVLRIEVGTRCPFYLDGAGAKMFRYARCHDVIHTAAPAPARYLGHRARRSPPPSPAAAPMRPTAPPPPAPAAPSPLGGPVSSARCPPTPRSPPRP